MSSNSLFVMFISFAPIGCSFTISRAIRIRFLKEQQQIVHLRLKSSCRRISARLNHIKTDVSTAIYIWMIHTRYELEFRDFKRPLILQSQLK